MKLSEVKNALTTIEKINFQLPNGEFVPKHFHVTEVGLTTKNFIDCGGKVREEKKINFQLWKNIDFHHRLPASKLLKIIEKSEEILGLDSSLEVEVEFQSDTIGKYFLSFNNDKFELLNTQTACLAKDVCVPEIVEKTKVKLSEMTEKVSSCCTPESGCC